MEDFSLHTPTQEPDLSTAMTVVYQWDYDPQVEELRRLYVKATEAQWIAERDIDWDRPIDQHRFGATPLGTPIPVEQTSYWKSLDEETVWQLTRRTTAFRLSNFLHGEQGALMVAAQLVKPCRTPMPSSTRRPRSWTRRDTSRCSPGTSKSSTRCGRSPSR
jgi:hypothetical protein